VRLCQQDTLVQESSGTAETTMCKISKLPVLELRKHTLCNVNIYVAKTNK